MRGGGAASAPPHPGVRGFADAGVTTPAASRNIPAAQGHVPVHRLSEEQGLTAERNDLDGRGMAQGRLLAHHPGRIADGRNQAQHHADDRGTPPSDSEMPTTRTPPNDTAIPAASRRGNPVQQPAAQQREENRADVDKHCGGASVDVTFAPVERDHIQPEPEQPRAESSRPGCPGRPAATAEQPHHAEGERGHKQAPQRECTRREMPACAADHYEGRSPQHHGYRCRSDSPRIVTRPARLGGRYFDSWRIMDSWFGPLA